MMGQLMVIGRTMWGPKVPTLKGTEASLSYVQCFLYLVSSSVNVSIFPITWLDTFLTDFVYYCNTKIFAWTEPNFDLYPDHKGRMREPRGLGRRFTRVREVKNNTKQMGGDLIHVKLIWVCKLVPVRVSLPRSHRDWETGAQLSWDDREE